MYNTLNSFRLFQSTSPVWRTTWYLRQNPGYLLISIHVPRVEDDHPPQWHYSCSRYFNPRPPCGGRLDEEVVYQSTVDISIHVPRVEDDSAGGRCAADG